MANRLIQILILFVVFSFLATILHEYGHFVILKLIGGDGILLFGFGPLIFPWDESHVVATSIPPGTGNFLIFSSGGSLFAIFILSILFYSLKDRNARIGLEFAIMPQIAWTLAEPLSWIARSSSGSITQINSIIPSFYSFHIVLIGSWAIAAIHLSGIYREFMRIPGIKSR